MTITIQENLPILIVNLLKHFLLIQNHISSSSAKPLIPIIYYFNKKIRWQSHYIPKDNVLRGGQLFDKYFSVKFDLLEEAIQNISCNQEFIKIFDYMVAKIKDI